MGQVVYREPQQERLQLFALVFGERREELALDLARELAEADEHSSALGSKPHEVAAAIARVAAALDEASLLELVEQTDELATVIAERVRDRTLRLVLVLARERFRRRTARWRSSAR